MKGRQKATTTAVHGIPRIKSPPCFAAIIAIVAIMVDPVINTIVIAVAAIMMVIIITCTFTILMVVTLHLRRQAYRSIHRSTGLE